MEPKKLVSVFCFLATLSLGQHGVAAKIYTTDVTQLRVLAGDNATLSCEVPSGPKDFTGAIATWFKNSGTIATPLFEFYGVNNRLDEAPHFFNTPSDIKDRLIFDRLLWPPTLTLMEVEKSDETIYDCQFYFDRKTYSRTFNVSVIDESHVEAVAGDNVVLHCNITTGIPFRFMTGFWRKKGLEKRLYTFAAFDNRLDEGSHVPSTDNNFIGRLLYDPLSQPTALTLKNVQTSDEGVYWCSFHVDGHTYEEATRLNITRRNGRCSVLASDEVNIDILSCGDSEDLDSSCVQEGQVPILTVVNADCWGVLQRMYRCHYDGLWREMDDNFPINPSQNSAMRTLCMPLHINSKLCGQKSDFQKNSSLPFNANPIVSAHNLFPFVVGLKRRQRFACTGTLITPYFVLTAAHCIIKSQDQPTSVMDTQELLVQWNEDITSDHYVEAIHVHLSYTGGQTNLNDIALVRMQRPLVFDRNMYTACVFLEEGPIEIPSSALAFTRPKGLGSWEYNFSAIKQEIDHRCQRCPTLNISDTQFCSLSKDEVAQLDEGDFGGPFLQFQTVTHSDVQWSIKGIASIRQDVSSCQDPPTIFTKVASFKDWITRIVNDDF